MLNEAFLPAPEGIATLVGRFQHVHLNAAIFGTRPLHRPGDEPIAGPLPAYRADLDMYPMLAVAAFKERVQGSEIVVKGRRSVSDRVSCPVSVLAGQAGDKSF